jgi:lipoate synthase
MLRFYQLALGTKLRAQHTLAGVKVNRLRTGETGDEVMTTLRDLRQNDVDIVTIGQYLQPPNRHLKVERYVTPQEFQEFKAEGSSGMRPSRWRVFTEN